MMTALGLTSVRVRTRDAEEPASVGEWGCCRTSSSVEEDERASIMDYPENDRVGPRIGGFGIMVGILTD